MCLIGLLFITGCSQKPDSTSINNTLGKVEKQLNTTNEIVTTASSYDGKSTIEFRLMVKGTHSKEAANKLFAKIVKGVKEKANRDDIWNYYNGQFNIKNYTNGVVYKATKIVGKSMVVNQIVSQ